MNVLLFCSSGVLTGFRSGRGRRGSDDVETGRPLFGGPLFGDGCLEDVGGGDKEGGAL